jgi:cytochrome c553
VQRFTAIVDDAPLPGPTDERNYTILQVIGTQGTDSSYMLYASDVLDARLATPTKTWPAGDYSATGGDYFHRTVPWNPTANNPTCLATINTFPLPAACTTANDAPNGRPATSTTLGQVAFNDQISAWCSTCHSRYYSSTNPNPGGEPGSSSFLARSVSAIDLGTNTITVSGTLPSGGTITSTGFSVGDVVQFTATPSAPDLSTGTWYVVFASSLTFRVSATYDGAPVDITGYSGGGTVVRTAPASASSWWFPRPGETIYKFQHQTTTNRSCVTCHVSHGSNAAMPGSGTTDYSGTMAYPDGSAATAGFNSRLLKVDNRGTCQMCHAPTGTATAGQILPNPPGTAPSVP